MSTNKIKMAESIQDYQETIQDVIGAMLNSLTGIDIVYNDATGQLDFTVTPAYIAAMDYTGWIPVADSWTYASADAPVYQIYVSGNATADQNYKLGNKIKCTNNSTTVYGFVVKVGAFDSGNNRTPVDLYLGTDYALANSAITAPKVSKVKSPDGFPMNPDKWTVTVTDTSNRTQSSPTASTWYNPGSLSITIPIGIWSVSYKVLMQAVANSATVMNQKSTLSTANNSESDGDFTEWSQLGGASGNIQYLRTAISIKLLSLTSKTTYYLNCSTTASPATSIAHRGDLVKTIIKAVCSYL